MGDLTLIDDQDNYVTMSNKAARGAQGLSLREKRLVALAISKNNSLIPPMGIGYNQRRIKITVSEYAREYAIDRKIAYRDIKEAGNNLFERYLKYEIMTPKGLRERKFRWVQDIEYHHGEGWISFQFTEAISAHLYDLHERFTSYKLKQAVALRSIYAWRLLELLMSWHSKDNSDKGDFTIDLTDFRKAMEVPSKYKFHDIRVRCIEPAIRELKQKDGIITDYITIKKGRAVNKIHLTWCRKIS